MLINGPTYILSLLPVPLQILLGMDCWECMRDLYPSWRGGDGDLDEDDIEEDYQFEEEDESDFDEYDDY